MRNDQKDDLPESEVLFSRLALSYLIASFFTPSILGSAFIIGRLLSFKSNYLKLTDQRITLVTGTVRTDTFGAPQHFIKLRADMPKSMLTLGF